MNAVDPNVRPTLRALLLLAWPVILSRATQTVVGLSDAWMVAPLGESSLAATTTGAFDSYVLILFPMGVVFILQSFAAQLRGRGELGSLRRYARYGFVLSALSGLLAVAMIPLVPTIVGWLGYEPDVTREMSLYLAIRLVGVGGAIGVEAIGNWFGGLGNTRVAMIAGAVTMISNLLLCYLLIEPRFGLPGYGVAGAAVASVLATYLGFAAALVAYLRGTREFPEDPGPSMRWDEFVRVVRFGLPNGVSWLLEFSAFALFANVIIGGLGTTALAALNVVFQVNGVAFMPAFGLATAGSILVGESIGRGDKDDVGRIVRMTAVTAGIWMGLVGVVFALVPEAVIGSFSEDPSSEFVAVGASMLALSIGWQFFDAIGITVGESLRAAGDTTFCMIARILIAWIFFLPIATYAVEVRGDGTTGALLAMTAYIAILSVVLALRFASGRWRSIELVEEAIA